MPDNQKNIAVQKHQLPIDTASSLITGFFSAGIFNPWDKALYLSVVHHRPFLLRKNFYAPFQGLSQTLIHRTYTSGLYYILQAELGQRFHPVLRNKYHLNELSSQFVVGLMIGAASGVMGNGLAAVKYHTWGHEDRNLRCSVKQMWTHGGIFPFFRGMNATIARDMTFAAFYEGLRYLFRAQLDGELGKRIISDFMAAFIATSFSAPFNYARVQQYATSPKERAPSMRESFRKIMHQAEPYKGLSKISFFQRHFKLGWGTSRVGCSMALGQTLFDACRSNLTDYYASKHSFETPPKNSP